MKTPCLLLFLLLGAALFSGCQTPPPVLPPPSAHLRANLGQIQVVALTNAPRIRLQIPDSRADIMAETESFELVTPQMVGRQIGPVSGGPEALVAGSVALTAPALIMGGAPLWQELRRGYGLLIADSPTAVARASSALQRTVADFRFEQQLAERAQHTLAVQMPTRVHAAVVRGADTVFELMVYEPSLSGSEGINPGLQLCLGVRVRLLNARTRGQIYYDYLDYRGPRRSFVRWAEDDARLFREELDRCLSHLCAEIVAQLFTRSPAEIPNRTALASLGIERRPPSPGTSAGGNLWSPRSTRGLYARR